MSADMPRGRYFHSRSGGDREGRARAHAPRPLSTTAPPPSLCSRTVPSSTAIVRAPDAQRPPPHARTRWSLGRCVAALALRRQLANVRLASGGESSLVAPMMVVRAAAAVDRRAGARIALVSRKSMQGKGVSSFISVGGNGIVARPFPGNTAATWSKRRRPHARIAKKNARKPQFTPNIPASSPKITRQRVRPSALRLPLTDPARS